MNELDKINNPLSETEEKEYQRLKGLEELHREMGKTLPDYIKQKLENYRRRVGETISEDAGDEAEPNGEIGDIREIREIGGKPVFKAKSGDGEYGILRGDEQGGEQYEEIEKSRNWLQEAITAFRNIRAEANINPGKEVPALIRTSDAEEIKILEDNKLFLMKLAKLSSLDFGENIQKPELSGFRVVGKSELIVPLLGLLYTEAE